MRRAMPFLLFAIAVVTALWLSAQPDRGRPSAARELAETPPVGAGRADTNARQSAVWPPPSGIEAPQGVPAAQRKDRAPVPEPTSALDETELEVEAGPEFAAAPTADPDTAAPEFDEAAFQWNEEPLPPKRAKKHVSSMDAKRTPREAPPLMPVAVASAPAPADTTTPPPTTTPLRDTPPAPTAFLPPPPAPLDLSKLPEPIQVIESARRADNTNQALDWTNTSGGSSSTMGE